MPKDPICGMYVEDTSTLISNVEGRTYYFCSADCKFQFDAPYLSLRRHEIETAVAWVIAVAVVLLQYLHPLIPVLIALATVAQFYPGFKFYRGAYDALRNRSSNMDTLIALGTTTAYVYTLLSVSTGHAQLYFDASTLIIALIRSGNLMEEVSHVSATTSTRRLLELQPSVARRISDGKEEMVDASLLNPGDVVEVRPGEKIPADGTVLSGEAYVDLSAVTGESAPSRVFPGAAVVGGTLNVDGMLRIRVDAPGNEGVLSEIIKTVKNAGQAKSSVQKLADRISSFFVPLVVSVAVISSLSWFFIAHAPLSFSVLVFVSVIIIACPCAMGIATPAALLVGAGKGAENGMLIRNPEAFERASKIRTIVFDKTGTLTTGRFSVKYISSQEPDFLKLLASLERFSTHSIAQGIVEQYLRTGGDFFEVTEFRNYPGHGVSGKINGRTYWAGRLSTAEKLGYEVQHDSPHGTVVFLGCEGKVLGYAELEDTVRPEARKVIEALRGYRIVMLTGDSEYAASYVASALGISEFAHSMTPEGKRDYVLSLKKEGQVAMVGDGINDAPAMSVSDLSIAMGNATDISKAAGDIVLLRNNLMDVVSSLALGRKIISKVRQNLAWAFGYNSVLIPVAAGALVPLVGMGIYSIMPVLSALAMAFSSTTVVGNSLLLRRFGIPGVSI
jgi:Cu+-exporting ATPase